MLLSDACQREVGVFSLFICFDATNFVLLGPFTLEKRFALKKWGQTHFKKQQHKSTLPVDVRHSKILSLNPPLSLATVPEVFARFPSRS